MSLHVDFRRLDKLSRHLKDEKYWVYLGVLREAGGITGYDPEGPEISSRTTLSNTGLTMTRLETDRGPFYEHAPRFELVPGFRPPLENALRVYFTVILHQTSDNNEIFQVMARRSAGGSTPLLQIEVKGGIIYARYKYRNELRRSVIGLLTDECLSSSPTSFEVRGVYGDFFTVFINGEEAAHIKSERQHHAQCYQFQYGLYSAPNKGKANKAACITFQEISLTSSPPQSELAEMRALVLQYVEDVEKLTRALSNKMV